MEIRDFLALSNVALDLRVSDKAALLNELAQQAAAALAAFGLTAPEISGALLKREELGSTGTGEGVALPHARLPGLTKPFGLFARLSKAIDFEAVDDKPVDVVLLVLLPVNSNAAPLNALACAARALRDAKVIRELRRATGQAEAYEVLAG
jgi:PTS system nitrogen regulatory IIA component